MQKAISEYKLIHDRETMPWMQQAAFDRGSFATLLGIEFSSDWRGARVFALGDSILAVVESGQIRKTIPYENAVEFDQAPSLLSTNQRENGWIDNYIMHELDISSYEAPTLLLMTDALGRWLLDGPNPARVSMLLGLRGQDEFREFVDRERSEGRLKRDDTTLVVIGTDCGLPAAH
jgi:hypothetical protein